MNDWITTFWTGPIFTEQAWLCITSAKVAPITDILSKGYTKQNPKRVPRNPTIISAVSGVRLGMKN